MKKNVRASALQLTKQTADSLSSIFNAGSDTSDLIYSDLIIQQSVNHYKSSPLSIQVELSQDMAARLNHVVFSSSFVRSINIVKDGSLGWGSGTFSSVKLKRMDFNNLAWVKDSREKDGELVWNGLRRDPFSGGGENTDLVLPISRAMKDFQSLNQIGILLVNLNGKTIVDTISQVKLGETGSYMVVNRQGVIMIDPDLSKVGQVVPTRELYDQIVMNDASEFEITIKDTQYYGVKQLLSNGWILVGTVPASEIIGALDKLHSRILLTSAGFAMIAVIIGLIIAKLVTNPIKQLTIGMRKVQQGDLKVRTQVKSSDEFGLMSRNFNKMLNEIEQLMTRVSEEERQKMEAEIKAITYRIHPHFLYNTLSTLRWLIRSGEKDRADQGLAALTRLLQANMGKNGQLITLAEELEIIEKYLAILEMRYDHKYELVLDIELGIKQFKIPRMLLQPLVENAVFHGFVPLNRGGTIKIASVKEPGEIRIIVEDDGAGMTPKQLRELTTASGQKKTGIGLKHISDSLRLYYDDGSTMTVDSEVGKGTQILIAIRFPKEVGK
ncbi:cache domain-containing sensor histidine kinase [Paenibacillus ihumii]|uniref:cache domain-containing sensor histidine kinase n=1 Tax=Paenibacillus ihumii TaxID=687436 RepID=UPI001E2EB4BC|nr:sensor histidine kinase [Paenibacillus ihumii]